MNPSSMDLESRRIRLVELLLQVDEEKLISLIEGLVSSLGIQLPKAALTSEELDRRIAKAHEDIDAGRTISSEDLLNEIQVW